MDMMTFGKALQNALPFLVPGFVYVAVLRLWRGIPLPEIAGRLGLSLGKAQSYIHTCIITALVVLPTIWISSWSSTFQGSMLGPYVGVAPGVVSVSSALSYGFIATGLPEEFLFRGLIAGALFRRLSFWKANLLQASIFLAPHLLILIFAPQLWPIVILLPFGVGLVAGWLRHSSGSIWPGVLFHAIPNLTGALYVMNWGG